MVPHMQAPGFFEVFLEAPPLFQFFGGAIFLVVVITFGYVFIKGAGTWAANQAAPELTRNAAVADKRERVWGGAGNSSASTSYFVTFEFEDGSRSELQVHGHDFGLLVRGDRGTLTYRGSRFIGFQRKADQEQA